MAPQTKEVGGGPATGLADQFVSWLSQGLNTGSFGPGAPAGADAHGATMGIGSYLTDILSGGAGKIGGATADLVTKQGERDAAAVRARYGVGGGTAFGTPGAYAEGMVRSETAPKLVSAIGGLQQNALQMLLPLFANIAGKGITQRQTVSQQSPWATAAGIAAPLISAGLNFMAPGAGAAASMMMPNLGAMPGVGITPNGAVGGGPQWTLPPVATLPF